MTYDARIAAGKALIDARAKVELAPKEHGTFAITNGTVEYTTPRPFESPSARVTLSYTIEPGEDAEAKTEMVGEIAKRRAVGMLSVAPVSNLETNPHTDLIIKAGAEVRPVVDIMGVPNPTATVALPVAEAEQPEVPVPQAVTITDQRLMDEVTARNAALITAAGGDDLKRQQAPAFIHALIGRYVDVPPGPGRLSKMPQDKRADFLKKLGEL